jgi:hypothetical protein
MRRLLVFASVFALSVALTFATSAAADTPTPTLHHDVFVDVNPCTGLLHTVTVDQIHWETADGVSHSKDAVTTSSGFIGGGPEAGVFHDAIFVINNMLYNAATGERIRAHIVVIYGEATSIAFTCIPPG